MNTKEKIKKAAVEMFNEKGATNVSTVQLSERLGISPGNLYYYYDNKEHLIREIWTEDIITSIDMLFFREDFGHSENGILNFFLDYTKALYKFRFFYAEVYVLLKNDAEMLDLYRSRYQKLFAQLESVMGKWTETGIMKELSSQQKQQLTGNLWMVVQHWINFASIIEGKEEQAETVINEVVLHCYSLLAPHFTDHARDRIKVLLKMKGIIADDEQ